MSAAWHVRAGSRRWGPLAADALRARADRGEFGAGALVWRPGLPSWQPLVEHFAPRLRRRDAFKLGAGLLLVAALGSLSVGLHLNQLERFGSLRLGLGLWGLSLAALVLVSGLVAWRGWRRGQRLQPFRPMAAGLQRMGALVVLLAAGGIATMQALTMPALYPTLVLREGFRDYAIVPGQGPAGDEVHVSGSIGPGFSQALALVLAQQSDPPRVVISSPGGLVDEAMLAALELRRRQAEVTARRECDSACVIVLLGGERRLADWNLALGFHAVSDLREEVPDTAADGVVPGLAADVRRFMRARGVPVDVLDEADGYAANELLPVTAIRLTEAGALDGLTAGGREEVGLDEAKWRFIEGLYAWRDPDDPMADLMRLARESQPRLVARWAAPIHAAYSSHAMSTAGQLVGEFAGDVFVRALRAADDAAVSAYYQHTLATLEALAGDRRWQACEALVEGRPYGGGAAPVDAGQVRAQVAAILALAESARAGGWQPRPAASLEQQRDGRALLSGALHQAVGRHDGEPRSRCQGYVSIYAALLEVSPEEAAPLLRWLGAPDG